MSLLKKSDYLIGPYTGQCFPPLPCPACGHALTIKVENINSIETGWSLRSIEAEAIGQEDREGVFTVVANCEREMCYESVIITGNDYIDILEHSDGTGAYETVYKIKYIIPTVEIFPIAQECSESVREHLMSSFSLFWSNPSSAGNSLRCALEALMDVKNVQKKFKIRQGKFKPLTLDARIKKFGDRAAANKPIEDYLLAIKWIGNAGSHKANLTQKDLIGAYQLTEHALNEIYEQKSTRLKKLAKRVINNKGPK